jgi:tRNA modification GTPase
MAVADIDTIAAVATPPGRGGIGVVRISGTQTRSLALKLLGKLPAPRLATLAAFRDARGQTLDRGLALFFSSPHSYTGEDVLELHGHGGPMVLDALLARVMECGARLARPGEFTERAFLNGKLDLAQAEAVADIIDAGSHEAARAALRSLEGEFSRRVHGCTEQLTRLRIYVEAAIDFPEEEIDFLADDRITAELELIERALCELREGAKQGSLLHDGMTVVLAGPPNAGKSSLLNALSERDTAIVSAIPGTTRDILKEHLHIDGMPLHVVDTAGLRTSNDEIEAEGMRRARVHMQQADRVLFVIDADAAQGSDVLNAREQLPSDVPCTLIRNKIDLTQDVPSIVDRAGQTEIALSVKTGAGLGILRDHLKACMGMQSANEGTFSARRRHLDAIRRAQTHVEQGRIALMDKRAGELLAEELRRAQQALAEITGELTADDLLGRIFMDFCIGK